MNPIAVALSLMREALTLLDMVEAEAVVKHLRLAIEAAEGHPTLSSPPSTNREDGKPSV